MMFVVVEAADLHLRQVPASQGAPGDGDLADMVMDGMSKHERLELWRGLGR